MVAHDRIEVNREPMLDRGKFVLVAIFALLLCVHWGLSDWSPQPYGTAAIDGSEVELFAPAGGSPMLIFAVAAVLLFGRRKQLFDSLGHRPSWTIGVAMLALGAGIERWADYVRAPELLIPSLILLLLGSAAILGGRPGLRTVSIPALFLVFAFPIPAGLVNKFVWPLQLWTASSTEWFLRVTGFAPEKFADIVMLNNHSFQVIETCSGMRMIQTLTMAAALYSVLLFRRRSQVVVLLLLAPAIGYFVNFVRVLSIIFNPYSEWSEIHSLQGVIMLVIGVLIIAGLDNLLQRIETRLPPAPITPSEEQTHPPLDNWNRAIVPVGCLLLLWIGNLVIQPWTPNVMHTPRAFQLPGVLAGSDPRSLKLDRQFLGSVGVTNWLNREYKFDGSKVRIQILADDRLDRRGSVLSRKTSIPGRGFVERSHEVVPLFENTFVDRYVYQERGFRTLVFHWFEGVASEPVEIVRNALVLDRGPTRRNEWALSVRLSTVIDSHSTGEVAADRRLRDFAAAVRDALQ